jgi:hypothetical protein
MQQVGPDQSTDSDLLGTDHVHDGDRSRDGFKGKQGSHGNHGGTSVLHLNILVASILLGRKLLLQSKVVKVEVTRFRLGGLAPEIVSGMSDTLALRNGNETQDGSEPNGLFSGEGSKSLGPVRLVGEAREVKSKTESTLQSW